MTTPDYSRGYLRVPLAVWEAVYCRAPLTRRQLQLVSVVLRETWGWQDRGGTVRLWTRPLSTRQFAQATGLSTSRLRRDLQALVDQGILLAQAGRYQFVFPPDRWITARPLAKPGAKTALPNAETAPTIAETALSRRPKDKRKIHKRNGGSPEHRLSPAGDNSRVPASALPVEERLIAILVAFVGPLPDGWIARLREWIGREGIAIVWRTLEPALRQGSTAARVALAEQLARRV